MGAVLRIAGIARQERLFLRRQRDAGAQRRIRQQRIAKALQRRDDQPDAALQQFILLLRQQARAHDRGERS
ncbi:MAG: hypothetical protein RMJ55_18860, partial [Roseiflexaceae bacterium]|nr:hypothetical protein [Roseiflexaceae bacterium]